jgi:hypothetical protein
MRTLIFHASVEDIYSALPPDTDLRSHAFFRAVAERALASGAFQVETDGIEVVVYADEAQECGSVV